MATRPSTALLNDVIRTIRDAKAEGLQVLLDFHYSDSWADGGKQPIPQDWSGITDDAKLVRYAVPLHLLHPYNA